MRARAVVNGFLVWTVLVWAGRIRNVLADDGLSAGGRTWRLGAAAVFVALAGATGWMRIRRHRHAATLLAVLAGWTVLWWAVRGTGILLHDHDGAFKAVHTVLMVVSIGWAVWAWRRRDG